MEYVVEPYKDNNQKKIDNYYAFQNFLNMKKIDINAEIAGLAGKLRGTYDFLKGLDSLQIAAAHFFDCDCFVTNDKSLVQVQEIKNPLLVCNMQSEQGFRPRGHKKAAGEAAFCAGGGYA